MPYMDPVGYRWIVPERMKDMPPKKRGGSSYAFFWNTWILWGLKINYFSGV